MAILRPLARHFIRAGTAFLLLVVMLVWVPLSPAKAQGLVRDTEVEAVIREFAVPLFGVAGLNPSSVRIHLVSSPDFNAFVAGGQRIFIHTGLILQSDEVGELIGVIAHETGHIEGGHLVRLQQQLQSAGPVQILATILGVAAGVASGDPSVGAAIATGTTVTQQRLLLAYSRVQENSADQAALRYLDDLQWSAKGFQRSMNRLSGQELRIGGNQSEYLRSHPLSRDRLAAITDHVSRSAYSQNEFPPEYDEQYARIRAKIAGFTQSLSQIFTDYPESDMSVPGRYARAVAHHRANDLERALEAIDALIDDFPDDPFFHELKGQFLVEQGRPRDAIGPYSTALEIRPASPLIRIALAQSLLALRSEGADRDALALMRAAIRDEPFSVNGWRQLAIAEGRNGNFGLSALALAEMNLAGGNAREALAQAQRATALLPVGSPGALRAEDIETIAQRRLRR